MKPDTLNKNLLEAIEAHIPKGSSVANTLMEILFIGKEAIYRRLRGEVPFTLHEAVMIARKLNISLDNNLGALSDKSRPFQLKVIEYFDPLEPDFLLMEQYINILRSNKDASFSETGTCENTFPHAFYLNYRYLTKFSIFKWLYHYKGAESPRPFEKVEPSERLLQMQKDVLIELKRIKNTYYIFDYMIFIHLVNDIKYFSNINLISEEDRYNIKVDLLKFLNDLEILAANGHFETGNKVMFYISNINFESTYTYIQTSKYKMSLVRAFTLNYVASLDIQTFDKMKNWIQSLRKTSILISESGEMQRIQFFKKQKEIINTL